LLNRLRDQFLELDIVTFRNERADFKAERFSFTSCAIKELLRMVVRCEVTDDGDLDVRLNSFWYILDDFRRRFSIRTSR
jgi:hypothetical protein